MSPPPLLRRLRDQLPSLTPHLDARTPIPSSILLNFLQDLNDYLSHTPLPTAITSLPQAPKILTHACRYPSNLIYTTLSTLLIHTVTLYASKSHSNVTETELTACAGKWASELLSRLMGWKVEEKNKDDEEEHGKKKMMMIVEKEQGEEEKWGCSRGKVDEEVVAWALERLPQDTSRIYDSNSEVVNDVVLGLVGLGNVNVVGHVVEKILEVGERVDEKTAKVIADWDGYDGLCVGVKRRVISGWPEGLVEREIERSQRCFQRGRCVGWWECRCGVETLAETMYYDLGVFWEVFGAVTKSKMWEEPKRLWWREVWDGVRSVARDRNGEENAGLALRWGVKWRNLIAALDRGWEYVAGELQLLADCGTTSWGEACDLMSVLTGWTEDGIAEIAKNETSAKLVEAISVLLFVSSTEFQGKEERESLFSLESLKESERYKKVLKILTDLNDGRLDVKRWREVDIGNGYIAAACATIVMEDRCPIRKVLEGEQTRSFLQETLLQAEKRAFVLSPRNSKVKALRDIQRRGQRIYELHKIAANTMQKFILSKESEQPENSVALEDLQRRCLWFSEVLGARERE